MARSFAVRPRSRALFVLCATLCIGVSAQERIIMDLPLPPAAGVQQISVSPQARQGAAPASALTSKQATNLPAAHTSAPEPTSRPASGELAGASRSTSPGAAQGAIKGQVKNQTRQFQVLRLTLREGESLYRIFRRHGLSQTDLLNMTHSSRAIGRRLGRLQPGQELRIEVTAGSNVNRLVLIKPGPTDVSIERRAPQRYAMREVADSAPAPRAQALPRTPIAVVAIKSAQLSADMAALAERAAKQVRIEHQQTPPAAQAPRQANLRTIQLKVKAGDSLYAIFGRAGLQPSELATLLRAGKPAAKLRRLRPGQNVTLVLSPDNTLQSMSVELDETRTFNAVRQSADSFAATIETHPLERRVATASAVIENALFLAGQRAGLSDRLIMKMVEIFGWDVDFALDVRAGDNFTVIYEELFKNGEKVRDGNILASEFSNRGRSIRAVRYVNEAGRAEYFSPKGFSMRKAFLRTPVNFSRISSRFNRGRMHPVLQRMRAHRGVDYAAARGTPIRAAGDGRVVLSGRKGGYGKTVVLQHGGTYTTLYAHMSRIHARARRGKRVEQGEIIGYVGKTGLATGPHLHYEFRVRGVHKDPLRVKLPKALPIDRRYKKDFLQKTRPLVAQLDVLARTSIASRD